MIVGFVIARLITPEDISKAIKLFEDKKANAVISVCPTEHSPFWCNTLPEDLSMNNFINPKYANERSQDLPKTYRLNGTIYIINTTILEKEKSIDIDSLLDFKITEQFFIFF